MSLALNRRTPAMFPKSLRQAERRKVPAKPSSETEAVSSTFAVASRSFLPSGTCQGGRPLAWSKPRWTPLWYEHDLLPECWWRRLQRLWLPLGRYRRTRVGENFLRLRPEPG